MIERQNCKLRNFVYRSINDFDVSLIVSEGIQYDQIQLLAN